MGAFGPKRVVTADDTHSPAAPYRLVDNEYSLLDVSDLVFIDAPGTGFGHLRGADKEKAFYGVDQDAHAFANFIVEFLSRHGRWNSPKYLFGESYGTTRSAALANILQNEKSLDLNGVILLSQILNFDTSADEPQFNPGVDLPYALALPTYAATAWYHHKLPNQPAALEPLLQRGREFRADRLSAGACGGLDVERRTQGGDCGQAARLHGLAGRLHRARQSARQRRRVREDADGQRRHHRPARHAIRRPDHRSDEQGGGLRSAIGRDLLGLRVGVQRLRAHHAQIRRQQNLQAEMFDVEKVWDMLHQPPGSPSKVAGPVNVMPDLAVAMKQNPNLKVQLNGGYYDLATPYFAAVYELHQLPIQSALQGNIEMHFYTSGHMVYAHEPDLKALHANVAAFIEKTRNGSGK